MVVLSWFVAPSGRCSRYAATCPVSSPCPYYSESHVQLQETRSFQSQIRQSRMQRAYFLYIAVDLHLATKFAPGDVPRATVRISSTLVLLPSVRTIHPTTGAQSPTEDRETVPGSERHGRGRHLCTPIATATPALRVHPPPLRQPAPSLPPHTLPTPLTPSARAASSPRSSAPPPPPHASAPAPRP